MAHVASITIDHTKVLEDTTDFPIFVDLSDMPATFWDLVTNGGGDIRCYKNDGSTALPREIVFCDTATDQGEMHVKFSGTLSSATDTTIQIHVDGVSTEPAADSTYGSENVWPSDHVAVYHLQDNYLDSTANHNDLTSSGSPVFSTTNPLATGGKSLDLESGSSQYAGIDDGSQTGLDLAGDFTMFGWMNRESISSVMTLAGKYDSTNALRQYTLQLRTDNALQIGVSDDGTNSAGHLKTFVSTPTFTTTKTFRHVGASFDISEETAVFFNQGADSAPASSGGTGIGASLYNGTVQFRLGSEVTSGGQYFDGLLDEWRIINAVKSPNYVETVYNNQSSPSTFYSVVAVLAKSIQAKASINKSGVATIQAKARIQQIGITKTIQAKARIQQNDIPKSVQAKARIIGAEVETIQAKANIFNTTIQTVQAKAAVKNEKEKSIQAKARLKMANNSYTIQARARIKTTSSKLLTAKARLRKQRNGFIGMRSTQQRYPISMEDSRFLN